ncbi:MAG TPA: aldo/keto reductase [Candidatus Binataceae bacterium]|nr:aldo/keto reductase [Candidatus Binataceae bacterium]
MKQRAFGKTGLKVSPLGFGGSEIGYQAVSPKIVAKLLGAALDAGVNAIDTAECYPDSEQLIGNAISHRRHDYHLFTKCGHVSGVLERLRYSEWDPRLLAKSIDQSLKNLRTDHLDLVQLHSCSKAVLRKGEVITVLQQAKQAGKTRFIGYSGDGDDALYAVNSGAFDALQISVSIADQESIGRVIPIAMKRGLGIIAKRPVANAIWFSSRVGADDYSRPYWDRLKKLDFDFLKQSGAEAFASALRFTLSVPGVHTAIVGTTKPERIAANVDAVSAPLGKREFDAIRSRWNEVAKPSWTGQT